MAVKKGPRSVRSERATELSVRPVGPDDWAVVARLFGNNGACGGCWDMWWRVPRGGKLWQESKGTPNRNALRRLLQRGQVHAVLAFAGDEAVGWCSFGPRADFPRLERVRALAHPVTPATWAITCFFVPARWRGHGVASALCEAATERALALGAREVEGYPVVPTRADAPMPAAFAWTGIPALFRRTGYRKLARPLGIRPIYRKRSPR